MAEEVHYNKLVGNKPVKITQKFIKQKKNKTTYFYEVTRHEIMSDETYRNSRVYYKDKFDKYTIVVNGEDYDKFNVGTYVTIIARKNGSYVKRYKSN